MFLPLKLLLTTFLMLSVQINSAYAGNNILDDFTNTSEFLRVELDRKQKAYNSKWANDLRNAYRASPQYFRISASKHPECPSYTWWSTWPETNKQKHMEADQKLIKKITKILKGFPSKTVAKCTELSYIFYKGKPTNHWRNKNFLTVSTATLVIKNNSNGAIDTFRALIATNFMDRTAEKVGRIYNENLQQVCTFKNISDDLSSSTGSCKGIGSGKAVGKITNFRRGQYSMAFITDKASIFVTNLTPEKAKRKFPEVFK